MATWSHQIIRQDNAIQGGVDVAVEFIRSTGEKRVCTFHFGSESQITTSGPARLAAKKARYELGWSDLNRFDIGEGSKEILIKLIKVIRNNNDLTVEQVTTWYDNNFPDSVWKGGKILIKMQKYLTNELGFIPTWNQFKTYVINNIFEGIDG